MNIKLSVDSENEVQLDKHAKDSKLFFVAFLREIIHLILAQNIPENAAVNLSKVYILKNAKKTCKPNNSDLNRDWNTLFRSTADKDDEQNNLLAESNSNDIEETVT